MRKLIYLASAILILSTSTACVSQATNPNNSSDRTPNSSTDSQSKPPTKTVSDRWTQGKLTVKLYDQKAIPFTTYFPENDFVVESASSDEGTGVWFYSKVEGKKQELAYVHLFFPANSSTVAEMTKAVTGQRGLMETNKWTVRNRSQDVAYTWARERIDFDRPFNSQNNIMGTVYIGEHNGKAFRITEHFPADAGDGFAPRASIILQELQLREGDR